MRTIARALRVVATAMAFLAVAAGTSAQKIDFPLDTAITSSNSVMIGGQQVPYTVTVGTQPVWAAGENGGVVATLFYTYYQRSDVEDRINRPLVISFNGGPGSASPRRW